MTKLPNSLATMASGISSTIFLPSDPDELRDRWKLLLQEIMVGTKSDLFFEEIIAIVDKILENKCISTN